MNSHSRRNIDFVLHDIRHPVRRKPPAPPEREREIPWGALARGAVVLGVLLVVGFGISQPGFRANILDFKASVASLFENEESSSAARATTSDTTLLGLFQKLGDLVGAMRGLRDGVGALLNDGFNLFLGGQGEEFIAILKSIHSSLVGLDAFGLDFSRFVGAPAGTSGGLGDVGVLRDGLSALINFLDVPEERRIVLLFQNHSEIRPTGGFIGSYAEVVLERGAIKSIEVNDIYYPDRRLSDDVVPPRELQSITDGWGARDANWFFDFPASAEKVLEFLEASDVYAPSGVKFDGAVAINAYVVEDFLAVTGPIEVPSYGVTFTQDNFLFEAREEVEESRDEDPTQNPKQVLGEMLPILLARLKEADSGGKQALMLSLLNRIGTKDIQIYFRDPELQKSVEAFGAAGKVYALPSDFIGDYLAVVNTNVAGGKSDIFIDQSIALNSRIGADGKVANQLTVTRRHFGENEAEPLYRARNQNFIRIYTVPGALLRSVSGITPKEINPLADYKSGGYRRDPMLAALEATREALEAFDLVAYVETGKRVFAGWFSTDAGEASVLKLDYTGMTVPLTSGTKFRFVFEKQSGVESKLAYSIEAPPGFYWKESGAPAFNLKSDSQPRRIVVDLTLAQ